MRLLFVIKALHAVSGGAERVLAELTAELAERGHDVHILCFDRPNDKPFYKFSDKVSFINKGVGSPLHKTSPKEFIERAFIIRKTAKDLQPDIVIGFMHSAFVTCSFALWDKKTPVIASEHIVTDHYKERKFEFWMLRISAFLFQKMTVISDQIKTHYPKTMHDKIVAISNPVSSPIVTDKKKQNVILSVGRLEEQKDHQTLISAFALIAHELPDFQLRIVGDGSLKDKLQKQIENVGLSERIALTGNIRDIHHEYQKAHIFVMPSRYESFGLATAEAMTYGLPCIGFVDCPGTNELIQNGKSGILVDPGTHKDRAKNLAAAISGLIQDDKKATKLGKAGQKSIAQYQIKTITDHWEELFKEVTNLGS